MMRVIALLLLSSVAIAGSAAWTETWAQTDGSRQIVIEEKDKDAKKAEPAKEEAAPAREEAAEDAEPAREEAPAKAEVKEEAKEAEPAKDDEAEEKPAKAIVEDEGKPADVIVKEAVKEEPPLVIVLQTELKRVGCYHGQVDGEWGQGSSEALKDFYHYGKVSISKFDPTPDALALVKGKKGVVCLAHDSPQDDYGEYGSDGGYGGGGGYSDGY